MRDVSPESPEGRARLARARAKLGEHLQRVGPGQRPFEVTKRVLVGVYNDGFIHAGNLAYLALLTLFPFFIVAAALARLFGRTDDGMRTGEAFLGTLPPEVKDGPITLGVRPVHLRLDPAGAMAEIVVIEPTGSETQVTLSLGGQDLVGVFRERISAGPGERIGVSFNTNLLHLFDVSTGKRIPR